MAKLVFGMNQSLDGYVDHLEMRPDPVLFRHFIVALDLNRGFRQGRSFYDI